ncbi:hypothetical protein [Rhodopirellula bahusiensis]|uniref:hypothetical protein n=1 Tax=Rhodopirellula bahusiensis TaxID=2014065 RepID=UPI003263C798
MKRIRLLPHDCGCLIQAMETALYPFSMRGLVFHARSRHRLETNMNVDAIHTALGIAFTAVWLFVGQIIVDSH